MKKYLALVLFIGSMGLAGWTFHEYSSSGEAVLTLELKEKEGALYDLKLDPAMSPARAFLSVDYEIYIQDVSNDAYSFEVSLKGPAGQILFSETHHHSVKKDDRGSPRETSEMNHILATFDVPASGLYELNWSVQPRKATVQGIAFKVRRNVAALNSHMLMLAGGCFLLGVLVIASSLKRRR